MARMFQHLSAEIQKLRFVEVIFRVVRPPRTDLEVSITETITDVINGRQ
jgi:hypothetical protein